MTSDRFVAPAPTAKEKFVPVLGVLVPENVWAAVVKVIAMAETTANLNAICVFIKCVNYVNWDADLSARMLRV